MIPLVSIHDKLAYLQSIVSSWESKRITPVLHFWSTSSSPSEFSMVYIDQEKEQAKEQGRGQELENELKCELENELENDCENECENELENELDRKHWKEKERTKCVESQNLEGMWKESPGTSVMLCSGSSVVRKDVEVSLTSTLVGGFENNSWNFQLLGERRKDAEVEKRWQKRGKFESMTTFLRRGKLKLLPTSLFPGFSSSATEECEFFLGSSFLYFANMEPGTWGNTFKMHEVYLDMHCCCKIINNRDLSTKNKSLLQIGLPLGVPCALFGLPPVVLEFPNDLAMIRWKLSIERVIGALYRPNSVPKLLCDSDVSGYLYICKFGNSLNLFKKHFFALSNRALTFYESENDYFHKKPTQTIPMRSCFISLAPEGKHRYPALELICHDDSFTYVLGADSRCELSKWIEFIKSAAANEFSQLCCFC